MNLTLHLIGRDFHYPYLLLSLAGWWALVILQGVLIGTFAPLPHQSFAFEMMSQVFLSLLVWLVAILKIALLALIVSQLVQKDSMVGSTAFWLSRPISGSRLLASKFFFLVLTVILPALLAEVLLLLFHGVTFYDTLRSIPQIVLLQVFVAVVLMMLAALTPNLPRFILLGILAAVGLALVQYTFWLFFYWLRHYAHQSQQRGLLLYTLDVLRHLNQDSSLYASGVIGYLLFFIALAGIVVCHQYRTQRTKRSMILASSVFPGLLLFLSFWTWDFWSLEHPPPKAILNPERVTARIERKSLKFHRSDYPGRDKRLFLQGEVAVDNLPPNLVVLPARISANLFAASGVTLDQHRSDISYMFRNFSPGSRHFSDPRWHQVKAALLAQSLGGVKFLNPERIGKRPPPELFAIGSEVYGRHKGDRTNYSAEVDFLVQRDEITRMRLEPGVRYDRGSDHAEILAVNPQSYRSPEHGFTIQLSESTHRLTLDGSTVIRYLLINSSRGEALLGQRSFIGFDSLSSPVLFSDSFQMLQVRRPSLSFDLPPDGPAVDETWLEGAELVRIETTHLGMFSKTMRIEDFVMERIPVSDAGSE